MKILLATDGTKHSESAVEIIKSLMLDVGDELKVISVIDMAVPLAIDIYAGYLPSPSEIESAVTKNAKKLLNTTVQNLADFFRDRNISITSEILHGSPESRIVETAEDMNADLIVVGSHGYNRWERLLLGSVSDSVVHHAPCSVLVVRSKAE